MYTRRRIHYPHFSPWFLSLGGLGRHGQDQSGSIDPEESGALVGMGGISGVIENCNLQWIFPLKMVIFHSYVSLPEGIFPFGIHDEIWDINLGGDIQFHSETPLAHWRRVFEGFGMGFDPKKDGNLKEFDGDGFCWSIYHPFCGWPQCFTQGKFFL